MRLPIDNSELTVQFHAMQAITVSDEVALPPSRFDVCSQGATPSPFLLRVDRVPRHQTRSAVDRVLASASVCSGLARRRRRGYIAQRTTAGLHRPVAQRSDRPARPAQQCSPTQTDRRQTLGIGEENAGPHLQTLKYCVAPSWMDRRGARSPPC